MSAEYFTIEEVRDSSKYYEGYCVSKKAITPEERYFGVDEIEEITVTSKKSQARLHEIEEQLVQAEDKCNKLKNQLDFMKRIYQQGDFRNKFPQSQSFDEAEKKKKRAPKEQPIFPMVQSAQIRNKDLVGFLRQNSNAISTDTTGAAVKTINNILSGITDSVNRLSELHSHIHDTEPEPVPLITRKDASVEAKMASNTNGKYVKKSTKSDASEDTSAEKVHDIRKKRPSVVSIRSKKMKKIYKNKAMKTKESSSSVISSKIHVFGSTVTTNENTKKKSGTSETKARSSSKPPSAYGKSNTESRKSTRQARRIVRSKTTISSKTQIMNSSSKSQNLVELFHNSAVRESDSEGSTTCIKQSKTCQTVPPLKIEHNQTQSYDNSKNKENLKNDENNYVEPATPRINGNDESGIVKRYEFPTIASKMKQVEKNYWRNFDVRSIPFCPAKSTSPSHNIGLNIQQVMSIMKTRQPLSGISPTLAHNIGLAAGKLTNSPLSTLMTTLGSRIGCGKTQCPMMKENINYHKLCELAKELPDDMMVDTFLDAGQGDARNGGNAMYVAANDGSHYPETCWTIDSSRNSRCTCLPHKSSEFNSSLPLQKFRSTATYDTMDSSTQPPWSYDTSRVRQMVTAHGYTIAPPIQCHYVQQPVENPNDSNVPSNLRGKEKSLKAVLQNLHDEFEIMNREYEDFADKIDKNEVDNLEVAREQLDSMEKSLNNKEEEIQIVMALYKEVLALKEQVRKLKQKSTVVSYYPPKIPGVKDQNAVIHLTKLLKQIQSYQRYCYLRKSM